MISLHSVCFANSSATKKRSLFSPSGSVKLECRPLGSRMPPSQNRFLSIRTPPAQVPSQKPNLGRIIIQIGELLEPKVKFRTDSLQLLAVGSGESCENLLAAAAKVNQNLPTVLS